MKQRTRLNPKLRKQQIFKEAMEIAIEIGYKKISRKLLSDRLDIAETLILHYFNSIANLKKMILKEAIETDNAKIIAQGICEKNPIALKAPEHLKKKALKYISEY